jgi:hypothetical protein
MRFFSSEKLHTKLIYFALNETNNYSVKIRKKRDYRFL